MVDNHESDDNTLDTISTTASDTGMDAGTIAPDDDVILVVGAPKSRFRVDSRCLSAASKVFKAMFRSKWSEGRDLSHSEPKDVALPEDDPFAFFVICCVVHHCNDKVPDSLASQQLLEVAIAADKYELKYARAQPSERPGPGAELGSGWLPPCSGVCVQGCRALCRDLVQPHGEQLWLIHGPVQGGGDPKYVAKHDLLYLPFALVFELGVDDPNDLFLVLLEERRTLMNGN